MTTNVDMLEKKYFSIIFQLIYIGKKPLFLLLEKSMFFFPHIGFFCRDFFTWQFERNFHFVNVTIYILESDFGWLNGCDFPHTVSIYVYFSPNKKAVALMDEKFTIQACDLLRS